MNTTGKLTFWRNVMITFGFFGTYYAALKFLAMLWRDLSVFNKIFTGTAGHLLLWFPFEFLYWLFCFVSGFLLPIVILSKRRCAWSVALAAVFSIHVLLFKFVRYASEPSVFDLSLQHLKWLLPFPVCLLGTLLRYRTMKEKPKPPVNPENLILP